MKRPSWMTPGEHRLALLLLILAVVGLLARQLNRLSPEVEAWLLEPIPVIEEEHPEKAPEPPPPTVVDPNLASARDLDTLPGIGPALAKRIIAGRPYREHADLLRVRGIGPSTLEKISPRLVFTDPPVLGQSTHAPARP